MGALGSQERFTVRTDNIAAYARALIREVSRTEHPSLEIRNIELPGLSVRLHSLDDTLTQAAETNFVSSRVPGIAPARLNAFIVYPDAGKFPHPASWSSRDHYSPHRVAENLAAENLHASHFHDLDHWHVYDPASETAVQLMRGPGAFPPWEPGAPLRPFLHWHYAMRGMRLAHAGTLGIDGKGVLLAGAGGSGKSGTVIAGLLNGLQSAGDDYVLLRIENGVCAHPLFATLKQDPEGFRRLRLDDVLPAASGLNWQGKHQFTMRDITRTPVPDRLEMMALLVPEVAAADRTRIFPIARKDAMMALAASSLYQMPGERESGFRFFSKVTNSLPCFRVELGREPKEIAGAIANFIQRPTS